MQIKKLLAHNSNYGSIRNTNSIKYIVIHYTANKGDKAISNCKYFQSPNRQASAHFFIDSEEIYQSVEDNVVAWSVGGNKYPNCNVTGGGKWHGKCTNNNSISIEMCDSVDFVPQKTKDNVRELTSYLMKKYNIPKENVIRHFDCVGKTCPKPLIDNTKWNEFKEYITTERYSISKVKVNLFGTLKTIDTINKDNTNYVKLRDLDCAKLKVGYSGNPTVNGESLKLDDVNSILLVGNNYVKIRLLEELGFSVGYDTKTKTIEIK